jgi:quinone-modifying oxidoreductase subunit QmoB
MTNVLICRGCDIETTLDVDGLIRVAKEQAGKGLVEAVACLCDQHGRARIRECGNAEEKALVLGACSSRFVPLELGVAASVERVALREFAAWCHEANQAETQAVAEDYLRMGLVRAAKSDRPVPTLLEVARCVLVVGGGPTGIAAALVAARAGYDVVLVEKQPQLGGWLRNTVRLLPSHAPYREHEPANLAELLDEVANTPRISVKTNASIRKVTGQPGQFHVELVAGDTAAEFDVGAIVQATGWRPYDASKLTHLGYGKSADIVTNVEFERMLNDGAVKRPSDGKPARRIAFVQCAGSRDSAHLPYCSTVCCRTTLKQALWARELDAECEAYVLAKDVRAPGVHENFYRRAQEDPLIFFTKGDITNVEVGDAGRLSVVIEHGLLGESVALEADLVVLAVGMVPNVSNNDILRELSDARVTLAKNNQDRVAAEATVRRLEVYSDTGTLGLGYRQGPEIPLDRYGFPDSHFICFPYESRRTGIYAAGAMRAPNDVATSRVDGEGAALKAIQAIEHAAAGIAMHPRWGDIAPPSFNLQRCTQCKRCTEECPFGTLDEDEKYTPKLNPARCRRCGICFGACPERIISYPTYSIDMISSMIKSVPIPDEFEESPRILVFACENDAYPALELAGLHRQMYSHFVRIIPVRCLGSINTV